MASSAPAKKLHSGYLNPSSGNCDWLIEGYRLAGLLADAVWQLGSTIDPPSLSDLMQL